MCLVGGGEGGLDVFCLGRQRNNLGTGLTKGPGGGRKSWAQLLFNELCEIFQKNVFIGTFLYYHKALHLGCCSSPSSASYFHHDD